MKASRLLIVFFSMAIIGGAGLFYFKYQLPDLEFMRRDVNQRLLKIDGLDSSVSEFALRSRSGIDNNYDMLVRNTTLLDQAIKNFQVTYFNDGVMQGELLGMQFVSFSNELEIKKDNIENFKSHNSVLRNSEKYAPIVGRELMIAAENQGSPELAKFYGEVVLRLLEYARTASDAVDNVGTLKKLLSKIPNTEAQMPEVFLSKIIEFTNHISTVIVEKDQTDTYLREALLSTSDAQLEDLSNALNTWFSEMSQEQSYYDATVMLYIFLLLAFTGFIALKLKGLYQSLDGEVAIQTAEVKKAYEELNHSERQLMQAEKMASLGQLVAGVAHEINTPLGYITCNLNTVRLNMDELKVILNSSREMSAVVAHKPLDTKRLGAVVRSNVLAYREIRNRGTMSGIDELLKDSSFGLDEISDLIGSLRDFSRLDSGNASKVNIHTGLDATVKICNNSIGKRNLVKYYADDLPDIECMSAQLNQVFINVLNNAIQATDELEGRIEIKTKSVGDNIKIIFRDNGHGMDEDTKNRMFDPFFTTKDVNEGTGLGMSISYKIIKSHGGQILVESAPSHGTRITLLLPMAQKPGN